MKWENEWRARVTTYLFFISVLTTLLTKYHLYTNEMKRGKSLDVAMRFLGSIHRVSSLYIDRKDNRRRQTFYLLSFTV